MLIRLSFHTEYPSGVGDTVSIFLFPNLSLSARSKAALVSRRWYIELDSSMLTTYDNTASLLIHQKVDPIFG